jgi:hypothetical protein
MSHYLSLSVCLMCVCMYTPHNQSCLDFHSKVLNGRIPKLPGLWISTRYILVCACVCVCVCVYNCARTLVRYARGRAHRKSFSYATETTTTSPVVNEREMVQLREKKKKKRQLRFLFFVCFFPDFFEFIDSSTIFSGVGSGWGGA